MFNHTIISEGACEVLKTGPCGIVIFGASGDLAKKKLFSAVFKLYEETCLSDDFFVVGYARTKYTNEEFRNIIREVLDNDKTFVDAKRKDDFISKCYYVSGEYEKSDGYCVLFEKLMELHVQHNTLANVVYNLAIPPALYPSVIKMLAESGLLIRGRNDSPFNRVIIEKPFGHDYKSAVELNSFISEYASDKQIYRIDHYLGKDTVQNIFVFRYGNSIFEPVWNRNCIDHVQITVAEDIGIGSRAGYFDKSGQIRDMLQNHLMQLLCCVAMEPPVTMSEDKVRDEDKKLLSSIRPFDLNNLSEQLVLGQYDQGIVDGQQVRSYRQEDNVPFSSYTETYFATKMFIDNWRWQGVPFYMRCGKRMKRKVSKISVVFKKTPTSIFKAFGVSERLSNVISFNIYPDQGVSLKFQAKIPEKKMCIGALNMDFSYKAEFGEELNSDYSSLILDCILGDQSLFWRKDNVELAWQVITPVLEKIESQADEEKREMVKLYLSGSWGPRAAELFIEKDGRKWID